MTGAISGLHRSPFHGYSAEFSQYRPYRPGDDLKYLDWKLFARTDRLYTKQFRETTNLAAQITLDATASMTYAGASGVSKFVYARMLAAALAHVITAQGDAAGLTIFADGVRPLLPARGGAGHLRALLVALARLSPAGTTDAARALRRTLDLARRRGLIAVISDLYDDSEEMTRVLRQATRAGHDVILFHVLTRDEAEFPFRGPVELIDPETGRREPASGDTAASYRAEASRFLDAWRERAATAGADYVRLFTDIPLDAAVRAYLRRRAAGVPA